MPQSFKGLCPLDPRQGFAPEIKVRWSSRGKAPGGVEGAKPLEANRF